MAIDQLLSRLEGVKRTGKDRWMARCPAHDDKRASLAITELADGRVLCHCFALCDVQSVLSAVGLEFDALFPERVIDVHCKTERRPFPAADVLRAIAFEARLVSLAALDMAHGRTLTDESRERLMLANRRIIGGLEAGGLN
ncbi:MAG: DNA primase [Gallionella sp.]|nr:DNA primase [Gallionella sp.]